MHRISSKEVSPKKKSPHVERWRKSLRQALLNPALSEQQRVNVKKRLDEIASGKDYALEGRVVLPGAIPKDATPWAIGTNKTRKGD